MIPQTDDRTVTTATAERMIPARTISAYPRPENGPLGTWFACSAIPRKMVNSPPLSRVAPMMLMMR